MLFIICGHGNGDTGAVGNGYKEYERVRKLAERIKKFGGKNVTIGDTSKNWYKSKLVNNTNIPKGALVLELHMDSSSNKTARGAHVIIDKDLKADKYDEALAKYLSSVLIGRSEKIVKRDDIANLNRAQKYGINYRIAECGFISNVDDVKIFNTRMDEIAKGILKCFDIPVVSQPSESNSKPSELYRVQVGAFKSKANAEKLVNTLKSKGFDAYIVS